MFSEIKVIHRAEKETSTHVLLIYTGGTFGMIYDLKLKALVPFEFDKIIETLPEIQRFDFDLSFISLLQPIDSSSMSPSHWTALIELISKQYVNFSAFVLLHGTDTMAYTASALSFGLQQLSKPIILTGAQIPIGVVRTDARENLMTALEIASSTIDDRTVVPEVCIYFDGNLLRGNRSKKKESSIFNAFKSENYPALAEIGVSIAYNFPYIKPYQSDLPLKVYPHFENQIMLIKFFPGIQTNFIKHILQEDKLKGVILETYGSGNLPLDSELLAVLSEANLNGKVLVNISQCDGGSVLQGQYQTSLVLNKIGVISGTDMTTEAATTKLMHLFAIEKNVEKVKFLFEQEISGELTTN